MSENQYQKLVRLTHFVLSTTEHFPTLRGIAVDWEGDTIQMYFYNDGAILAELKNDYSCVGEEAWQYDIALPKASVISRL